MPDTMAHCKPGGGGCDQMEWNQPDRALSG
jgi:hypothetical protein